MLEKIFAKFNINLRKENGRIRNVIDVLEDMYLRLTPTDFIQIMREIEEEEKEENVFDKARGRKYEG